MRICSVSGCFEKHNCRGFCRKHYQQSTTKRPDPNWGVAPCPMSPTDAAWLAGIFDGEGCICIGRYPRVSVSNTCPLMIQRIYDLCGCGSLDLIIRPAWRTAYVWRLQNVSSIRSVLLAVYPYLVTKRKQAEVVFRWPVTGIKDASLRDQLRVECSALNRPTSVEEVSEEILRIREEARARLSINVSPKPRVMGPIFRPRGDTHPMARLTESQALDIKSRLEKGEVGSRLAREFGVTPSLISRIRKGKAWGWLEKTRGVLS